MAKTLRPPIVAVLGHVDHGKTSLLDAIRKTNVASREKGGITQSIGASVVTTKDGKKITFIDTPGHAAFSKMRSRGATASDIAILVVSADDGVKPQTKEAISFIKEAKVPYLVAVTKIDLPSASSDMVLTSLEKEEVFFEGRGGDVPYCMVSAKKAEGIEALLDLISLMAEVNEIKADVEGPLLAVVIETAKDKKGPLTSVVVKEGTISVGDTVFCDGIPTRVRGLFADGGLTVKKVEAGFPAAILGFSTLPSVGGLILSEKGVIPLSQKKENKIPEVMEGEIAIFLKAATQGALEALLASIPQGAVVVGSGVGDVTESDVFFAKAANAMILTFEARIPTQVGKLAEMEKVFVFRFGIIYELLEKILEFLSKRSGKEVARAEIKAVFPYENKKVAGCKVVMGTIKKGDEMTLLGADGKDMGVVKVISLKRMKADISLVKQGEEAGILFEPQLAFAEGDVLVSLEK